MAGLSTGGIPAYEVLRQAPQRMTYFLYGDQYSLCPVEYHQLMVAKIPHARFQKIKQCGHLSSLEQPQEVTRALHALLAE